MLLTLAGTPGGSCANSDPTLKTIGTLVSNASCQSHRTSVKAVRSICVGLPACRLVVSTTKDTSAFDGKHFLASRFVRRALLTATGQARVTLSLMVRALLKEQSVGYGSRKGA